MKIELNDSDLKRLKGAGRLGNFFNFFCLGLFLTVCVYLIAGIMFLQQEKFQKQKANMHIDKKLHGEFLDQFPIEKRKVNDITRDQALVTLSGYKETLLRINDIHYVSIGFFMMAGFFVILIVFYLRFASTLKLLGRINKKLQETP